MILLNLVMMMRNQKILRNKQYYVKEKVTIKKEIKTKEFWGCFRLFS